MKKIRTTHAVESVRTGASTVSRTLWEHHGCLIYSRPSFSGSEWIVEDANRKELGLFQRLGDARAWLDKRFGS